MKKVFAFFILLTFSWQAWAGENVKWNSVEGLQRLQKSNFNQDFYQLVNFYQPQANPLYCSIATSVILLNATSENAKIPSQKNIQINLPKEIGGGIAEFHSYAQSSFLNEATDKIKKREVIELKLAAGKKNGQDFFDAGMSMAEMGKILSEVYNFKVALQRFEKNDEKSRAQLRQDLQKYLSDNTNFVVVNFDGKIIGNGTRGHFSPVVAYDQDSDSVLVMDVALHKTTWYWTDLSKLAAAMNTKDGDSYRGYLIIKK